MRRFASLCLVLSALFAALLVTGCGGDSEDTTSTTTTEAAPVVVPEFAEIAPELEAAMAGQSSAAFDADLTATVTAEENSQLGTLASEPLTLDLSGAASETAVNLDATLAANGQEFAMSLSGDETSSYLSYKDQWYDLGEPLIGASPVAAENLGASFQPGDADKVWLAAAERADSGELAAPVNPVRAASTLRDAASPPADAVQAERLQAQMITLTEKLRAHGDLPAIGDPQALAQYVQDSTQREPEVITPAPQPNGGATTQTAPQPSGGDAPTQTTTPQPGGDTPTQTTPQPVTPSATTPEQIQAQLDQYGIVVEGTAGESADGSPTYDYRFAFTDAASLARAIRSEDPTTTQLQAQTIAGVLASPDFTMVISVYADTSELAGFEFAMTLAQEQLTRISGEGATDLAQSGLQSVQVQMGAEFSAWGESVQAEAPTGDVGTIDDLQRAILPDLMALSGGSTGAPAPGAAAPEGSAPPQTTPTTPTTPETGGAPQVEGSAGSTAPQAPQSNVPVDPAPGVDYSDTPD